MWDEDNEYKAALLLNVVRDEEIKVYNKLVFET